MEVNYPAQDDIAISDRGGIGQISNLTALRLSVINSILKYTVIWYLKLSIFHIRLIAVKVMPYCELSVIKDIQYSGKI